MKRTSLRLPLAVIVGLFVVGVITLTLLLGKQLPASLIISASVLFAVAIIMFTTLVFRMVERAEERLLARSRQLSAVQSAATALAGERELAPMLNRMVELSRDITGARYGALAVHGSNGTIERFITSGIDADQRELIGHPPIDIGLLGVIVNEAKTLRLSDIAVDSRAAGFPPHHPPMKSLLGVPVISKGTTIGNLYLTDKLDGAEFSEDDEEMLRVFAAHAAAAIETMRLQAELRTVAVLRERERIGMDLHDGIIQSIYAVSLGLEAAADDVPEDPERARRELNDAIERLNDIIRDVRSYIFELQPTQLGEDLGESLVNLVEDFRVNSLVEASVRLPERIPELPEPQRAALFHVAKEALVNARKHARATSVDLSLIPEDHTLRLAVHDNGDGFDPAQDQSSEHRGLRNMASRAEEAGGTLTVESSQGAGTTVSIAIGVPYEVTA